MSISSLRSSIERHRRDAADWQKKVSEETRKEAEKRQRIHSVQNSMTGSISASTLKSKNDEIVRLLNDLSKIEAQRAEYMKKQGASSTQLHKAEADLEKEMATERKKVQDAEDKRHKEQLERGRVLKQQLEERNRMASQPVFTSSAFPITTQQPSKQYDVFISHATEDKAEFVDPLAEALVERGCEVWYDDNILKIGSSLRKSIDRGLANSQYGVVVLSPSFFAKNWPQYELDGLVTREMNDGRELILPIWHNISKDEVLKISPTIADKVAFKTAVMTIEEIADKLANHIRGDSSE